MEEYYKGMLEATINGDLSAKNELLNVLNYIDELEQEKQELIDYLKEEQLFYYNQYKCSKKLEDLKRYNRLINEYDKILSKIERSKK